MEHVEVEPDGCDMGLTEHRHSPEPKVNRWFAILPGPSTAWVVRRDELL
jgi:hypothetical protein